MIKKFNFLLITILVVTLAFNSCTVEKRIHTKGYYINWHKSNNYVAKKEAPKESFSQEKINNEIVIENNEILFASSSDEFLILKKPNITDVKTNTFYNNDINSNNNDCDLIILKNGDEISAKVIDVGLDEVKYIKCDNLTGPTFTIRKSEIFMIKHANGSKTVLNDVSSSNASSSSNDEYYNSSPTEDDYIKTIGTNDKSFVVAVALWVFLGLIGFHRFYLGHIGMGILYLLTAGLCGIGWLIDGIMFLTGALQPKKGKYIDV